MEALFLRAQEVARLFNVARSTIYKWKDEGLPHIRVGRTVRFDEKAVIQWFKEHQVTSKDNTII